MRLSRLAIGCIWAVLALSCFSASAVAQPKESRIALVVGNAAYQNAEALKNPVNDARAMAKALEAAGFEIILRENVTRRQLVEALREFSTKVTPGGVGLFYYAGHGMQVRGANYLLPVDAVLSSELDLKYETMDVNDVLVQLDDARVRLSLMILDACRDNPFARRFRSTARGLAQVEAPRGTVIAYATAPGDTAADGTGDNGLYTAELLKAIGEPGLKLEEVFKRTIDGVARASGNKQTPWVSSSFRGEFYFINPPPPPPSVVVPPPPPPPPAVSSEALELAAWNAIATSTNPALFETFLDQFPNGVFARLARVRLEDLKATATAQDAARRAATEEVRRKADAEAAARQASADEARRKADADAEAKRAAADEARRKADAEAEAKRLADAAEQALQLTDAQRRRVQAALTIKGFDTGGTDGAFGPRTRQMIANYQRSRNEAPSGFLNAAQYTALLGETEQALARQDDERRRQEQERQKADDEARRKADAERSRSTAPAPVPAPVATGPRRFDGIWIGRYICDAGPKGLFTHPLSGVMANGTLSWQRGTPGERGFQSARGTIADDDTIVIRGGGLARGDGSNNTTKPGETYNFVYKGRFQGNSLVAMDTGNVDRRCRAEFTRQ